MASRQLNSNRIYQSLGQRLARQIHLYKARFRPKEQQRVEWLSQFFPHSSVILDVGAHFGYFSKEFSRLHQSSCSVFAFEPMSYNADILEIVTAKLPNVEIIKKAASDTNGVLDLNIPVKKQGKIGPGLAHFGTETDRDFIVQSVETIRLDDFVKDRALTRVDFIKIDIEGAELPALKGATNTIKRYKPVIFAEILDAFTQRMGYHPDELIGFLRNFGYTAHLVEIETLSFHPVSDYKKSGDYLFIPMSN